jgi:hypothetical protein
MIEVDTDEKVQVHAVGSPLADAQEVRSARERAAYSDADDAEVVPPWDMKVAAVVPTAILRMAIGTIAATCLRARRDARPYLDPWGRRHE